MKKWILFGVLTLLVLGAIVISRDTATRATRSSYQELEYIWGERFSADPVEAYAQFLAEGRSLSYDDAHKLSHTVGEVIYSREGDSGIARCSDDFGFGCYHGFAGSALTAHGLSAMEGLNDVCEHRAGNYLGCEHGLGHGILAYLGNENFSEALNACPPYRSGTDVGGCYGGVFMEYNYNTMRSVNGIDPRPFDAAEPYAPCTEVEPRFRTPCYYELPSWWRTSLGSHDTDPLDRYSILGSRCAGGDSRYRSICFRGIGNTIGPASGYDAALMKEWCDVIPSAGRALCYHEALGHLLQSSEGREQLKSLCAEGKLTDEDYCGK